MDVERLRSLLEEVRAGKVEIDEALDALRGLPYEDIGYARLDHHRPLRQGWPEVVFAQGKTPEQIAEIMARLARHNPLVMATRTDEETYRAVAGALPDARYYPQARIIALGEPRPAPADRYILVVSAGTADLPVAEEAAVTAELIGNRVERLYDVGVAGVHRLLAHRQKLEKARVIVVVAGMEGALPSVVGGLVGCPVIAVPTSVGYGASFQGLAALLAMLNSCTVGMAVVNIDNGFGAGWLAGIINRI
ncbi:MAG: nickel pincer cofactor biosynthesis protein LarB [Anaerolineae bacterium]